MHPILYPTSSFFSQQRDPQNMEMQQFHPFQSNMSTPHQPLHSAAHSHAFTDMLQQDPIGRLQGLDISGRGPHVMKPESTSISVSESSNRFWCKVFQPSPAPICWIVHRLTYWQPKVLPIFEINSFRATGLSFFGSFSGLIHSWVRSCCIPTLLFFGVFFLVGIEGFPMIRKMQHSFKASLNICSVVSIQNHIAERRNLFVIQPVVLSLSSKWDANSMSTFSGNSIIIHQHSQCLVTWLLLNAVSISYSMNFELKHYTPCVGF